MNRYGLYLILTGMLVILFLAACGSAPAPVVTTTVRPITLTPTATISPTPVPTAEPLPDDIVVYPGAQLVVAQRITTGTLYFYRSTAALNGVTDFYTNQMPQKGWAQTSAEPNGAQGESLVYSKDTRTVTLNIVPDPITQAQTDITITVSNNQ